MSEPDRPPQPLVVTLAALTVVSGFLDAVSFLGLGHVFIANMTGNVVLVGFAAAGAPGFSVAASLCALGFFLGRRRRRGSHRPTGAASPHAAAGRHGDGGHVHGGGRGRGRHRSRHRSRVAALHGDRAARLQPWASATRRCAGSGSAT